MALILLLLLVMIAPTTIGAFGGIGSSGSPVASARKNACRCVARRHTRHPEPWLWASREELESPPSPPPPPVDPVVVPSGPSVATELPDGEDPPGAVVGEVLAGLSVAFSLLSKAIACSAIVGVDPFVGIWSSVVVGFAGVAGGMRPGVIAGSAAVVAVPLGAFVAANGPELIPVVILGAAVVEGVVGALGLTRLIGLVSDDVLAGFLNALGALLFASQLGILNAPGTVGVAVLCAGVTLLLPRFSSAAVPSSLVGLALASAVGSFLGLPTLATVNPSAFAGSSLPTPTDLGALFSTSPEGLALALPASISIAFISLLETLLAARVVDDLKCEELCVFFEDEETPDFDAQGSTAFALPRLPPGDVPTASVLALAVGNGASALLGGFGGCGLIPQTVLNLNSGGGGVASTASYAASLAAFALVAAPLVGQISQAALAGIMLAVVYQTVQWGPTADVVRTAFGKDGPDAAAEDGGGGGWAGRRDAFISLAALVVASVSCYEVDFAVGIVLGVCVDKGLPVLLDRLEGEKS